MITQLNTITVGDALEYLEALPPASVPLFLFSPPYNLGHDSRRTTSKKAWQAKIVTDGYDTFDDAMPSDEYINWQHSILRACWRALASNGAIFYNHKPRVLDGVLVEPRIYVPSDLVIRQRIIWARGGGLNHSAMFYLPTYEEILVLAKPLFRLRSRGAGTMGDVWNISCVQSSWHPAPFPLPLAERVMETVRPALVCDPFMGSGTTAKAAKRYGIDWMGCEKSAAYAARATLEIEAIQPRALAMIADQEEMFV